MYYFFIRKKDLPRFREEYDHVAQSIEKGTTPVFSELRGARTMMLEVIPWNLLSGLFLIIGTLVINSFKMPELLKIAVVLVVNSIMGTMAQGIFVVVKHYFRKRFLRKIGVTPTEKAISILESLEYQTV